MTVRVATVRWDLPAVPLNQYNTPLPQTTKAPSWGTIYPSITAHSQSLSDSFRGDSTVTRLPYHFPFYQASLPLPNLLNTWPTFSLHVRSTQMELFLFNKSLLVSILCVCDESWGPTLLGCLPQGYTNPPSTYMFNTTISFYNYVAPIRMTRAELLIFIELRSLVALYPEYKFPLPGLSAGAPLILFPP